MKAVLSHYLHTSMTLETAKETFGDKDTTVTLEGADKDQNTILIQVIVEVDPDDPEATVDLYENESGECLEIFTLAWCGQRYTEEDRDQ
jgi:hypothetical protein